MVALIAFVSGLVFGLGLIISGMANPAKVLGFLDLAGSWDLHWRLSRPCWPAWGYSRLWSGLAREGNGAGKNPRITKPNILNNQKLLDIPVSLVDSEDICRWEWMCVSDKKMFI